MKKHLYNGHNVSFFGGEHKIDSYVCKYCKKTVHSTTDIKNMNKHSVFCESSSSLSTIIEDLKKTYDCSKETNTIKYMYIYFQLFLIKYRVLLRL